MINNHTEAKKILLINDEEAISKFIKEGLLSNNSCSVFTENNAQGALGLFQENIFDVVITKFGLPGIDGKDLIQKLKDIDPACAIILLIDEPDHEILQQISRLGVYDFITKPINLDKLYFLIKKGADLHYIMYSQHKLMQGFKEQNDSLQKQNILLVKRIEESTRNLTRLYEDLRTTYMRTIKVLAEVIDARDHYTHSHSQNVAKYAMAICEEMHLSSHDMEIIREACELHDLGKVGVDDFILSKPTSLTPEEWEQIKRHPLTAVKILEPLTFLSNIIMLIKQHHEHYDGSGYPEGRKGEDILLGARIIHIADAYEAMRSPRAYRKIPLTKEEAIAELKKNSGTQFDPSVVETFLRIVDKL